MASRRKPKAEQSLDSLLDTLTNVVGILLIMMALMQLSVGERVAELRGIDPAATPKRIESLRAEFAEMTKDVASLKHRLEAIQRNVSPVATSPIVAEDKAGMAVLQTAKSRHEKLTTERASLANELLKLEEKKASLLARLDKTKPPPEPPTKIIRLPNPREAPPGTSQVTFICRFGRIYLVEVDKQLRAANELIERAARIQPGRCDCAKAVAAYQRIAPEADRSGGCRWSLVDLGKVPHLKVDPLPDGGTATEEVARRNSLFQRQLRSFDPARAYLRFLVWPDSFETYLEARKATDRRRYLAGWQVFAPTDDFYVSLGATFVCADFVPPPPGPPRKTTAKPPPPEVVD